MTLNPALQAEETEELGDASASIVRVLVDGNPWARDRGRSAPPRPRPLLAGASLPQGPPPPPDAPPR